MARTNLPLSNLNAASGLVNPSATAVDVTNGMNIALPETAIPRGPMGWDLVIVFAATFAGSKNIIVRKGVNPPAFRADLGDLKVAANNQTAYVGPLDPSRYVQADGSINVDFDSGTTGTVLALALPHRGNTD